MCHIGRNLDHFDVKTIQDLNYMISGLSSKHIHVNKPSTKFQIDLLKSFNCFSKDVFMRLPREAQNTGGELLEFLVRTAGNHWTLEISRFV